MIPSTAAIPLVTTAQQSFTPLADANVASIDAAIADLLSSVKGLGYSAIALIQPLAQQINQTPARKLLASTSSLLRQAAREISAGSDQLSDEYIQSITLKESTHTWENTLAGIGFKHALIVRISAVGSICYEFILLSTSWNVDTNTSDLAAIKVHKAWARIRQSIRSQICPLTSRESEALQAIAAGMTGEEASEHMGCATRTFRMHADNARRKLNAENGAQAVHQAHLLCAF